MSRTRNVNAPFHRRHDLKRCPHCACFPKGWHSRWVLCGCGASMTGDDALLQWNRRRKRPKPAARLG